MAVSTTKTSATFVGTGVASAYAPEFYINNSDQVRVTVAGVLKTVGDDYTISGVGASIGCSILGTFTAGATEFVERVTPITQLIDTQNNETILEDVIDGEMDKLTMIAQELSGRVDRTVLVPKGELGGTLPPKAERFGKFLTWDANGLPFVSAGTGSVSDPGLRTDLLSSVGAAIIGWLQAGTGALARSVMSKLFDLPVSPRDFDITAGTGNATNDTAAINKALAAAAARNTRVIIDRPYLINGPLVRPAGSEMYGTSMAVPLLVLQAGNYDLFQFTGSWTVTENLQIDGSLRTSGADINFDLVASGASQVEHRFTNLFITGSTGGVKENYVSGGWTVYRLYFKNVKWAKQRGHGVRLFRGFGFIYFDHECLIEYIGTTSPNFTAFYFDGSALPVGAGGLHLGMSVVGTATVGATNTTQIGYDIRNAAAVFFMERARAENFGGKGIILTAINGFDFGPLAAAVHCNDVGVLITGCTQGTGSVKAIGRVGIGTPAASKDAIQIVGSDNINLTKAAGESATGNGISVATSTVVEIGQVVGILNQGRGWVTDANGVVGAKSGILASNGAGNYSQGGTFHRLRNVTIQSGACVDVDGVAAA